MKICVIFFQLTTSNFIQYDNIAAHVFPIILALFLGAWSDKRGRKFPLIMGLVGKLIYSIMIIVNDNQRELYTLNFNAVFIICKLFSSNMAS